MAGCWVTRHARHRHRHRHRACRCQNRILSRSLTWIDPIQDIEWRCHSSTILQWRPSRVTHMRAEGNRRRGLARDPPGPTSRQVLPEERDDAPARVGGRRLVIGAPRDRAQHFEDHGNAIAHAFVVVHESMTRVWILFDVVRHTHGREGALESGSRPPMNLTVAG